MQSTQSEDQFDKQSLQDYLSQLSKTLTPEDNSYAYNYKKHLKTKKLKINTSHCRGQLKIIRKIIKQNDWSEVFKQGDLLWSGLALQGEQMDIAYKIRVNRLPEMPHLCHKRTTGFILNKYRQYWPRQFQFYPKTYLLPQNQQKLRKRITSKGGTFIAKPSKGSQGDGIVLIKKVNDIPQFGSTEWIVQPYIDNPLLLDNRKFDLRLYAMISSVQPYICYLSEQGLGRLCTQQYEKPTKQNILNPYIHLTNYSLNKLHPQFENSQTQLGRGGKRCLKIIWEDLIKNNIDVKLVKSRIQSLAKKLFISFYPFVKYYYHAAYNKINNNNNNNSAKNFHVIGIDVLIDQKLQPWFLQANNNPSFNIQQQTKQQLEGKNELKKQISLVDLYVKRIIIEDAIYLACRSIEKQKQMKIGQQYYSFKKILDVDSQQIKQMNIIQNMLKLFHYHCSIRSKQILTSSQFVKLANLKGMTNDKISKNDYHLIFIKIMRNQFNQNQMEFQHFVQAIQYIIKQIKGYNKQNKVSVIKLFIDQLVQQL